MIISLGDISKTRESLEEYLKDYLGEDKFNKLVSTQSFRLILQLLSIAINYSQIAQSVARRESYIETAKNERSIFELVYNYGFVYPPQIPLQLEVEFSTDVALYDIVGVLDSYHIVPVKSLGSNKYLCIVGFYEEDEFTLSNPYDRVELDNKGKYLAKFDKLTTNNFNVSLCQDIAQVVKDPQLSILRGFLPYKTRLYFGDGNIGYFQSGEVLTYKRVSFNEDIQYLSISSAEWFLPTVSVTKASDAYYLKRIVNITSWLKYLPIDGRLVRELDFESLIPFIWDKVLSCKVTKRSGCCEVDLELVCDDDFYLNNYVKPFIDERKLIGIVVNYIVYRTVQGDTAILNLVGSEKESNLSPQIKEIFMSKYGFRLMREDEKIDLRKFISDVNSMLNTNFVLLEPYFIQPTPLTHSGFYKDVNVNIQVV